MITYNDIKNKVKITRDRIASELSNYTIPCPYCGEPYHRVAQHAQKTHGIEIPTFREIYQYTTAANACALKIMRLYSPKRDTYIQQYADYENDQVISKYITLNAEELKWDKYLSTKKLTSHIRGTKTFGAIFYPSASKVLVFDIDIYPESVGIAYDAITKKIIRAYAATPADFLLNALEENGVPQECIHILHSGKKGFHIDLYFDHWVNIDKLTSFGKYIIDYSYEKLTKEWGTPSEWEDDIAQFSVELRPEGREGRGVRFPLGIHRETGEVMAYCQRDVRYFPPVSDQYSYLLYETSQITKETFEIDVYPNVRRTISHGLVDSIPKPLSIPSAAPTARRQEDGMTPCHKPLIYNELATNIDLGTNNHRKSRHYTREELEAFWEKGLIQHGTRHNVTVGLAILLKEKGLTKNDAYNQLLTWNKEKLNGFSNSSWCRIKTDIRKIIKYAYMNDYHLQAHADTPWLITDTDIRTIATYYYLTLKEQKILTAIFMIRRHYGPDAYYPQKLIAEMTGYSTRTVRKHIKKFMDLGILKLTYRGDSFKRTSNKYDVVDYCKDYSKALSFNEEQIDGKAFVKGLKKFTSKEFIKARYSWYQKVANINSVKMIGFTIVTHPSIPKEKKSLPETNNTEKKVVGRKIFDEKICFSVIVIFKWVRKMKTKHGAQFAKIFPSWRGHYMRC